MLAKLIYLTDLRAESLTSCIQTVTNATLNLCLTIPLHPIVWYYTDKVIN